MSAQRPTQVRGIHVWATGGQELEFASRAAAVKWAVGAEVELVDRGAASKRKTRKRRAP